MVQRLYLDAIIVKDDAPKDDHTNDHATKHVNNAHEPTQQIDQTATYCINVQTSATTSPLPPREGETEEQQKEQKIITTPQTSVYADTAGKTDNNCNTGEV